MKELGSYSEGRLKPEGTPNKNQGMMVDSWRLKTKTEGDIEDKKKPENMRWLKIIVLKNLYLIQGTIQIRLHKLLDHNLFSK